MAAWAKPTLLDGRGAGVRPKLTLSLPKFAPKAALPNALPKASLPNLALRKAAMPVSPSSFFKPDLSAEAKRKLAGQSGEEMPLAAEVAAPKRFKLDAGNNSSLIEVAKGAAESVGLEISDSLAMLLAEDAIPKPALAAAQAKGAPHSRAPFQEDEESLEASAAALAAASFAQARGSAMATNFAAHSATRFPSMPQNGGFPELPPLDGVPELAPEALAAAEASLALHGMGRPMMQQEGPGELGPGYSAPTPAHVWQKLCIIAKKAHWSFSSDAGGFQGEALGVQGYVQDCGMGFLEQQGPMASFGQPSSSTNTPHWDRLAALAMQSGSASSTSPQGGAFGKGGVIRIAAPAMQLAVDDYGQDFGVDGGLGDLGYTIFDAPDGGYDMNAWGAEDMGGCKGSGKGGPKHEFTQTYTTEKVRRLIGPAGRNITRIRKSSGCWVNVSNEPVMGMQTLTFWGDENEIRLALQECEKILTQGGSAKPLDPERTEMQHPVTKDHAKRLIGPKGETIRQLRAQTKAFVKVENEDHPAEPGMGHPPGTHVQNMYIAGTEVQVRAAIVLISELLASPPGTELARPVIDAQAAADALQAGADGVGDLSVTDPAMAAMAASLAMAQAQAAAKPQKTEVTYVVTKHTARRIIGPAGSTIKEFRAKTGAFIKIQNEDFPANIGQPPEEQAQALYVSGTDEQVQGALALISELLASPDFRGPPRKLRTGGARLEQARASHNREVMRLTYDAQEGGSFY